MLFDEPNSALDPELTGEVLAAMKALAVDTHMNEVASGDPGRRYDDAMDPGQFLRLAVDPVRLSLLGRSVAGPVDAAATAVELGVPQRDAVTALGRLRAAGLIGDDLRIDLAVLRRVAASLPRQPPIDPALVGEGWTPEEAEVLGRFFSGGRLTSIPQTHAKRTIVLERLAQEFAPGLRYGEAEVNFTMQMFHADYASLRRYLVDEGFLTRADGVYWRTGGRHLTVLPSPGDGDDDAD
ncbi:hypothetical protein BH24ACT7_BH24ACT7_22460 [soil metagenome]